jgi:hypothetical protein
MAKNKYSRKGHAGLYIGDPGCHCEACQHHQAKQHESFVEGLIDLGRGIKRYDKQKYREFTNW